jgi:hypothetical protein
MGLHQSPQWGLLQCNVDKGVKMNLPDIEDALEASDSVVGWVVWKDEEDEMVVLGDEDGVPCLFASQAAAETCKGYLDVVAMVTQQQYDELCRKRAAIEEDPHLLTHKTYENGEPVEGDPDEDRQEAWVRSILASLERGGYRTSKPAVESELMSPQQAAELESPSPKQAVKLYRKSRKRRASRKGVSDSVDAVRGWVYLFRADDPVGMYKIGYSTDPVRRLKSIQATCPVSLAFEWAIPCWGNDGTELKIHRKFDGKRVHGEWFRLSKQDVKWIKGLPGGFPVRV